MQAIGSREELDPTYSLAQSSPCETQHRVMARACSRSHPAEAGRDRLDLVVSGGYLARRYTVSVFTPAAEVVTSFSSSPARLIAAFVSSPSLFGISAVSYRRTRVLSASLTDQVPKLAAKARAAAANSSVVAPVRR